MTVATAARLLACRVTLAATTLVLAVIDRLLDTHPQDLTWTPEARDEEETWQP